MIYNKETALEKARELSRRVREKTEPFDPEAELAAVLFEAQAEALESLEDGDPYDQPTAEGGVMEAMFIGIGVFFGLSGLGVLLYLAGRP